MSPAPLHVRRANSSRHNYEQIFYHRLLRYRREQEENFQASGVEPSASDYHHAGKARIRKSTTRASFLGAPQTRQRSQFSIARDPSRKSSSNTRHTASEAGTELSYDPFRASRRQMTSGVSSSPRVTFIRSSPASLRTSLANKPSNTTR